MKRRTLLILASMQLLCAASSQALAQAPASYPSRPIRLVVPFAAGTAPDILGRLVAPALAESKLKLPDIE
mgnify:CR=1 FL=1